MYTAVCWRCHHHPMSHIHVYYYHYLCIHRIAMSLMPLYILPNLWTAYTVCGPMTYSLHINVEYSMMYILMHWNTSHSSRCEYDQWSRPQGHPINGIPSNRSIRDGLLTIMSWTAFTSLIWVRSTRFRFTLQYNPNWRDRQQVARLLHLQTHRHYLM